MASFPQAVVVAGPETAEEIRSGRAAEQLRYSGPEWGARWPAELRVDRVVEPGVEHALGWVVPGHGPALEPAEARAVGEADLTYLDRLQERAREALACGLAPGHAIVAVYAVEPPRPTTDDFEIFGLRERNAQAAVAEAGDALAAD